MVMPVNDNISIETLLEINYNLCMLLMDLSHIAKKVDTMREKIQGLYGTEKGN